MQMQSYFLSPVLSLDCCGAWHLFSGIVKELLLVGSSQIKARSKALGHFRPRSPTLQVTQPRTFSPGKTRMLTCRFIRLQIKHLYSERGAQKLLTEVAKSYEKFVLAPKAEMYSPAFFVCIDKSVFLLTCKPVFPAWQFPHVLWNIARPLGVHFPYVTT